MTTLAEEQVNGKTEYPIIDIFKFIGAFLIIAVHDSPLYSFYDSLILKYLNIGIMLYVARIAVPFYFAAAGFFLFRKIDLAEFNSEIFNNHIKKNLRLLGIWTVLLFTGSTHHLWYIIKLIIAELFVEFLLLRKTKMKTMILIAVIFYIIGLLGDSYYGLLTPLRSCIPIDYVIRGYDAIFGTTRTGLFMGFPFLLLGGIVAKAKFKMKPLTAFIGLIISLICLLGEVILIIMFAIQRDYNMYLCLIPVVFFMMVFATSIKTAPKDIYKKLRTIGIVVYFSHLFVHQLATLFLSAVNIVFGIEISNSLLDFVLTASLSCLLGFIIEKLSHRKNLGFLKYLYS